MLTIYHLTNYLIHPLTTTLSPYLLISYLLIYLIYWVITTTTVFSKNHMSMIPTVSYLSTTIRN